MNIELLDTKISQGSQDYTLTNLYKAVIRKSGNGITSEWIHKLRVSVKSDSYNQQCHATCDVFSPEENKWNRLCHVPFGKMGTSSGLSHYLDAPNKGHFQLDVAELLRLAELILA